MSPAEVNRSEPTKNVADPQTAPTAAKYHGTAPTAKHSEPSANPQDSRRSRSDRGARAPNSSPGPGHRRLQRRELWQVGLVDRAAEAPVAVEVELDRAPQIDPAEVGPERVEEDELGIGATPRAGSWRCAAHRSTGRTGLRRAYPGCRGGAGSASR